MKETNIQCECGLCCGTLQDWHHHREATGHVHWQETTVGILTKEALKAIEGLRTFKKTTAGESEN